MRTVLVALAILAFMAGMFAASRALMWALERYASPWGMWAMLTILIVVLVCWVWRQAKEITG